MANRVNYTSRNFADIRTDLINFVKQYYPDIFNDFNDASVGMMLLELNAATGDMLSFNTDRMHQESQLDYAQEKASLLSMARTFGLKVPGKRPSITIVDFTVTLPVLGDSFDLSYAPVIRSGAQVTGVSKVFETMDDIDFSNPFSVGGIPNRIIIPNFNTNGTIINYSITKREIVINGSAKIFKKILSVQDVKPFLEVVLPDDNVLSIESIIILDGTNYVTDPTLDQFISFDNRWFEMDALAEDKVFVEDTTRSSDNVGISPAKYIKTNNKFIREYTDLGFTKLIFGGGTQDTDSLCAFDTNSALVNQIGDFINNLSLGKTVTPNTTMFVKYRVGGGSDSNLGQGVLKGLGIVNINVNGDDGGRNNAVKTSLTVNNPFPALGGRDEPSIEEIRNLVRYNFASQNRAVTLKDYISLIAKMPGKFGTPFRCGVFEERNMVNIYTIGLDSNGKLTNTSTTTLNENIANYLSEYRMMNDYIQITNGRIINIGFQIDLFIDKQYSQSQIISQVITDVTDYMDINKLQMGDTIHLSNLYEVINNVAGVLNVIDLRVYNNVGNGKYSLNEISQPYLDEDTREIDVTDNYSLYGDPTSLFEVRYPETDIIVRVKA
jgi:hypothetical protein